MGSDVIFHNCAQGVRHSSRLICSLMTSLATSRLRLDFHHIKVDLKKSEVVQPLTSDRPILIFYYRYQ